jgi:PAS domain S-box-containing protein
MFRLLFDRSADAMTLQDAVDGTFLDVNEAAVRITGAPGKAALMQRTPLAISPERQPDGSLSARKLREAAELALAQGSHRFEWCIHRFDGTLLPVEIVLTPIRNDGRPLLLSVARDLTERKRTEYQLHENQQLLASVADNLSEAIYRTTPAHELIFANRAYLRLSGYHSLEEMRRGPRERLYARPEDRARLLRLLEQEGCFRNEEIEYVRRDGTRWWGLTNSVAVRDESTGRILYHVGSVADVTERRHAADEIRQLNASLEQRIAERTAELSASEARLRTLIEQAPEAIIVFDGESGKMLTANPRALELLGCTEEELPTIGPWDVSPELQPDGRRSEEAARHWIAQAIAGRTPIFEWQHQHRSGRVIPTEVRLVRLPGEGRPLLRASIIDNTEHKRTEETLRRRTEQIQRHRDVLLKLARADKSNFETALRTITTLAANTLQVARVSYWSLCDDDTALAAELLHDGRTGKVDHQFTGTRVSVQDAPGYFAALELKRPIVAHDTAIHPATAGLVEGYLRPLGITSLLDVPVWVRGQVVGVICHEHVGPAREWSAEEIDFASSLAAMISLALEESRRARSESLLRDSEEKFRALFEASSQGIMLHDENQYLEVNPAVAKMLGYASAAELVGLHPGVTSPEFQPNGERTAVLARRYIHECLANGHVRFEWVAQRKDGQPVPVEVILTRIRWGGKQIIQAAVNDISQRKKAEEELLRTLAREKELGELKSSFVSMVSHEFRTPLGIIQSSAEILDDYLERLDPAERREQLQSIIKNSRRMASLMEEVLLVGRLDAGRMHFQPAGLNVSALCRQLVDETRSTTEGRCPIEFSTVGLPDDVHADERLLRHILLNLLSNAVKYSEPGQAVTLRVDWHRDTLEFLVQDQGIGIPEAEQARLFEAFHRGSNVGNRHGSGLGLVIVKRCVDLHGGSIQLASKPGQGTTVRVTLPVSAPAPVVATANTLSVP